MEHGEDRPPPVVVPHGELSPAALRGLVESFVLREGTDYGEREVSIEAKVDRVLQQLERGEAEIVFDPSSESVDIIVARPAGRESRGGRPK